METKSRYEVISDLEKQKRDLIKERDALDDKTKEKERQVKNYERKKENLETQKKDFDFNQVKALQNLANEKSDFELKMNNTLIMVEREITDAKEDLEYFKTTVNARKETIQELIKSVDDSLTRFNKFTEK